MNSVRLWLALVLVSGLLGTVPVALAEAGSPPLFGNGKGLNMPSAVLAKHEGGDTTPPVYQVQTRRYSPTLLKQVADAGFGFVRLVATPTPLMTDDPVARGRAINRLKGMIDAYQSAGLGVILDLHFWTSDDPLHQDNVLPDKILQAQLIRGQVALAKALAKRPSGRLAFEILNEPPCSVAGVPFDWVSVQRGIVRQIRAVAPRLPLVLTACRGSPHEMLKMDASAYRGDPHIYWTFHYYEPAAFVWAQNSGLVRVPFPPNPALADSPRDLAAMMPPAIQKRRSYLSSQLKSYLRDNRGQATIGAQMTAITAWARQQGISPKNIFVGEFASGIGGDPSHDAGRRAPVEYGSS